MVDAIGEVTLFSVCWRWKLSDCHKPLVKPPLNLVLSLDWAMT